jgi:hypothetical protein
MPRALYVDAELETFAPRDQLTARETPRRGPPPDAPSPILPPYRCTALGRCCSLLPFCRLLQRFLVALLVMQPMASLP